MITEPGDRPDGRRRRRGVAVTRIVYSAIVCALVLLLFNAVAWFLETVGGVNLDTGDSAIVYLSDAPYVRDADAYITNPRLRDTLVSGHFRAVKGDAWRLFVLGESFAMATPYVNQAQPQAREGGIASWLSADLQALYPSHPIEVINAAAGGQNSHRIRRIAEAVAALEPDALVVAACNNEGALPPGRVDEILHQTGGYRLLAKLAAPLVSPEERSQFTPQDPDVDAIRAAFETNLRAIVAAAGAHHVPVLLCTMPVNLRFIGGGAGHRFQDERDKQYAEPVPSACTQRAIEQFNANDSVGAVATLRSRDIDMEGLRFLGWRNSGSTRWTRRARCSACTPNWRRATAAGRRPASRCCRRTARRPAESRAWPTPSPSRRCRRSADGCRRSRRRTGRRAS